MARALPDFLECQIGGSQGFHRNRLPYGQEKEEEENIMSTANAKPDQDTVASEIEIAAPPERVFKALTDQKQLFHWWGSEPSVDLIKFDMDGRKGGKYYYECAPKPGSDMGPVADVLERNKARTFICHGEVVEIDPPRL